jgi:hypothetical protein
VYDPNDPGVGCWMTVTSSNTWNEYVNNGLNYNRIIYGGSGSLALTEPYNNILTDALADFHSSAGAVINITSHTSGQTVSTSNVILSGEIESGQVLVTKLIVLARDWLSADVGLDGKFSIPISLSTGTNHLYFETEGPNANGQLITLPNNMEKTDFTLIVPNYVLNFDSIMCGRGGIVIATCTINSDPDALCYPGVQLTAGTGVTIKASSVDEPYYRCLNMQFLGWGGDLAFCGTSNPCTFTMNSNVYATWNSNCFLCVGCPIVVCP